MLEEYKKTQPIAYKILTNSVEKQKISHAYLIDSNGYSKKLDFAKAFSKFLLCPSKTKDLENCKSCNICHRIDNNNFTELKIIEPDGLWIKKDQFEELQKEFSKKSIESTKKIYIINEAEKMNASAAASILKFLEEPEPNIIAILITDNIYQLMTTIRSRCQIISLKKDILTTDSNIDIKKNVVYNIASRRTTSNENLNAILNEAEDKYLNYINSIIKFVEIYEKKKIEVLTDINNLWNQIFNDKEKILLGLDIMIFYYKDILNYKLNRNLEIFDEYYDSIKAIATNNTQKEICSKIKIIINTKNKVKYNANSNLLIDKLLLELGEVA